MRRALALLAMAVLLVAGCGDTSDHASTAATDSTDAAAVSSSSSTSTTARSSTITTTLVNGKPHFGSPEDAMTYLADAWNHDDLVSLKHVTDPSARDELNAMHSVAENLTLDRCEANEAGDYTCYFDHDYPPHASTTMQMEDLEHGHAVFLVGPADTPGWYMTVFESCS